MKPLRVATYVPRRDRLDPTAPETATPADPHSHTCQSAQNKGHLSHVKPKVCANVERTRGLQSANQGELFHLDMQSRPRVLRATLSDTAVRIYHWNKKNAVYSPSDSCSRARPSEIMSAAWPMSERYRPHASSRELNCCSICAVMHEIHNGSDMRQRKCKKTVGLTFSSMSAGTGKPSVV